MGVRRSVLAFAAVAVAAAAVAAVLGLWLPASQHRKDVAWADAGGQALARVALPAAYSPVQPSSAGVACSSGPTSRCFLGPGDPKQQVGTLMAALAGVARGPVYAACHPVPLPGSPPSCHLSVPVAGSRLVADVYAAPRDTSKPLAQRTYSGAYVDIHVAQR